jgi:hypothetical protein
MRLAALLVVGLACASAQAQTQAEAQTPATKPVKPTAPTVAKPTPASRATVEAAKPADLPALKTSLRETEARQAGLEKKKAEQGGLGAEDMALLQKAMQSKSALESMISGVMENATASRRPVEKPTDEPAPAPASGAPADSKTSEGSETPVRSENKGS